MLTLQQAAEQVPVDWVLNCMASRILLENDADPDFYCSPDDIEEFQSTAPDLAQSMVDAANGRLPAVVPQGISDDEIQSIDRTAQDVARSTFAGLSTASQQRVTALVMSKVQDN